MIRDHFRVLMIDLATGRGNVLTVEGRDDVAGGSGLAALLFKRYAQVGRPWDDPDQPLIFAIGPLTGYFPLMSKTVCAFKSPYHDQYAESHAGGRSALAMRFADVDALVIVGKARRPSCLFIGSRSLEVREVHYLWGMDVQTTGKMLRHMFKGAGHRSILRIGPAGETKSAMACINVDTYRHFGRLGGGAVMGNKNLKGIVIQGDGVFDLAGNKEYPKLFADVHDKLVDTDMMSKYYCLGTPANIVHLNNLHALPIRNLQKTNDPAVSGITGETFAEKALLRNVACAGCPVGCIHIGFVRERFQDEYRFLYRQIAYDHEPIFAQGAMLGIYDASEVLSLFGVTEKVGLDMISSGVALAWATEALEKGIVTLEQTIVPLRFGAARTYAEALHHLATAPNDFYRLLAQGTRKAALHFGGEEFACVLGQEMAGYATGEVFFVSQALGLRHSHLDTAGYAYDQKTSGRDVDAAVAFFLEDEQFRVFLTSMVACLFARGVYTKELLAECLRAVGYERLADDIDGVAKRIQTLRWRNRFATGFDPKTVSIPKRFTEVVNWKGPIDKTFLARLTEAYSRAIIDVARPAAE